MNPTRSLPIIAEHQAMTSAGARRIGLPSRFCNLLGGLAHVRVSDQALLRGIVAWLVIDHRYRLHSPVAYSEKKAVEEHYAGLGQPVPTTDTG